jgi:hypothetical protein
MINGKGESEMSEKLIVLHPAVETETRQHPAQAASASARPALAPRLATLQGKRLALLDNSKVKAKELLTAVGKRLQAQYGVAQVRIWRKAASAIPAPFIADIMSWKPDLVLTASGD